MQIAVACDGLDISAYAPRCSSFMCYTADNGVLTNCRNLPNMGLTSHEAAMQLIDLGFDAFISGGIDAEMADELCEAGIDVVEGAKGTPREAVDAYLSGTLDNDLLPTCDSEEDPSESNDVPDRYSAEEDAEEMPARMNDSRDIDKAFAHITELFTTTA